MQNKKIALASLPCSIELFSTSKIDIIITGNINTSLENICATNVKDITLIGSISENNVYLSNSHLKNELLKKDFCTINFIDTIYKFVNTVTDIDELSKIICINNNIHINNNIFILTKNKESSSNFTKDELSIVNNAEVASNLSQNLKSKLL